MFLKTSNLIADIEKGKSNEKMFTDFYDWVDRYLEIKYLELFGINLFEKK